MKLVKHVQNTATAAALPMMATAPCRLRPKLAVLWLAAEREDVQYRTLFTTLYFSRWFCLDSATLYGCEPLSSVDEMPFGR